jgi:hypothetical protein
MSTPARDGTVELLLLIVLAVCVLGFIASWL